MFGKAKKDVKVGVILEIVVKEVTRDTQYEGRITGFGVPLTFTVTFSVPTSTLESYTRVGRAFGAPTQKIADVLNQTLKGRYALQIVREDGQPIIGVSPEQLRAELFRPIAMAIGLLQGKSVPEATFRVPYLSKEETAQFRNPTELQEFVLSLNR